jgi:hypothetical protein
MKRILVPRGEFNVRSLVCSDAVRRFFKNALTGTLQTTPQTAPMLIKK